MALPFFLEEVRNVIWIAVLYFVGSLFLLLNFPALSLAPQSKPFYITDLVENENDRRFVAVYEVLMIIAMSGMMSAFADYIYLRDMTNKSATEILAIIGGNITVYLKIQSITGKIMLKVCVCWRNRERSLSEEAVGEESS
jgi:hypothetical protein